eukprot:TRINITY_DN32362_c0_g1_i1.p1 TRINITY_DN32362_c0_g1~~TRINITY_DN32362_c0_g1_i1.p1  ORF type:complete len:195 (-),score=17.25 TRINITY_DN32362_c0_g1_i1:7-591(-)
MTPRRIILCSQSPRRKDILSRTGLPFEIIPSDFDEKSIDKSLHTPESFVEFNAENKAKWVLERNPDKSAVYIGCDTVVVCEGRILEKPTSIENAREMITLLQGREHYVISGVCVMDGANMHVFHEKTQVTFRPMSEEEVIEYVDTGESMDKAGGYGCQGLASVYITKFIGDYSNVVGLPICRLYQHLQSIGCLK